MEQGGEQSPPFPGDGTVVVVVVLLVVVVVLVLYLYPALFISFLTQKQKK